MTLEKIVIVSKETPLDMLKKRYATTSQARFYLESRGESYDFYADAHAQYHAGLQQTKASLPLDMRTQVIDKSLLGTYQFSDKDAVVVVGDPGLFVNVAKYVGGQPVIVVNPDQHRFDDTFTSCTPEVFPDFLSEVLEGNMTYSELTMAEACFVNGQVIHALNDFYIGRKSHVSSRYEITHCGESEHQSSDGVLVSTGTGSTGWLTSVISSAHAIAGVDYDISDVVFPRDADYLAFVALNTFPSRTSQKNIVKGRVTSNRPLKITSNMPEEGVIFSDGVESDYVEFNAGNTVLIQPAERKVYLAG